MLAIQFKEWDHYFTNLIMQLFIENIRRVASGADSTISFQMASSFF